MVNSMNPPTGRAGTYRQQPSGYRAFIPADLPPDPAVDVTGDLQAQLSRSDSALGRLDGSIQTLPNPDLFVFMYVRKEAVLSSQIEGTQSSLQDVLASEAKVLKPDKASDVNEVINYVSAMNHGLSQLTDLPVSTRLIREIHSKLLQNSRGSRLTPGQFRTSQNWIGPAGSTPGEAAFVPPPPDRVAECMSQLERFVHANTNLPLLIKIGLAHAQFETIHPFLDGNGRIGRLLITFLLCERKVLLKPVLYLSWYFKQHRQEYYDELQSVRDHGTWERWLMFFLQGVEEVSQQATDTARQILVLREEHRMIITGHLGRAAGNGHRVLEHLYESPFISVADVQRLTGTSYTAANNLIKKMVQCEILKEYTGQVRNRRFWYQSYMNLFESGGPQISPAR